MTEQIGLYKFKLTQKRYEAGAFYISVVTDGENAVALDGRFFLEEGNKLAPTRSGFRLPIEKLNDFAKALDGDLRQIDDIVLFENQSFQFHIRYLNDKYGEGVDLRKYKTTEKYTGWDKSGLRMKLEDVVIIHNWLNDFDIQAVKLSSNIFSGKDIGGEERDRGNDRMNSKAEVNPAMKAILDF